MRLDHPAEPDRGDRIVGVIGVDHQSNVRSDRLAHGARYCGILFHTEADLQLHGLESLRDIAGRFLGEIAKWIARLAPVKAGRVGLHLGAQRTADQPVHRDAKMLALDVPQRDVDAAQALDHEALLPVIAQPRIDHLPQIVGPQRIFTDQPRRYALHDGSGHPCRAVAFAPADQPGVGFDLDHHGGAGVVPGAGIGEGLREFGFENMRADGGDDHALSARFTRPIWMGKAKRAHPLAARSEINGGHASLGPPYGLRS